MHNHIDCLELTMCNTDTHAEGYAPRCFHITYCNYIDFIRASGATSSYCLHGIMHCCVLVYMIIFLFLFTTAPGIFLSHRNCSCYCIVFHTFFSFFFLYVPSRVYHMYVANEGLQIGFTTCMWLMRACK